MKIKYKCDECKLLFRHLSFTEGKNLCYYCRRKRGKLIKCPIKFSEYLSRNLTLYIKLTESQLNLFNKRIKELGITKTEYIRTLILSEINQSEK